MDTACSVLLGSSRNSHVPSEVLTSHAFQVTSVMSRTFSFGYVHLFIPGIADTFCEFFSVVVRVLYKTFLITHLYLFSSSFLKFSSISML